MRQAALAIFLLPILLGVCIYAARNYAGEVVILHTTDESGRPFQTKLWILDQGHQLWVRSAHPTSPWLDRIARNPAVELERGSELRAYRATPLAHRRERINALMAERYRWADWLLGFIEDREQSVPVLLAPQFS